MTADGGGPARRAVRGLPAGTVVLATALALAPGPLTAQPRGGCVLSWEPTTPTTRSVSTRQGPDAHVTHVSGGMLWTCGTATMEADSAVKYDLAGRVDLIGNVFYRDTIRTLRSRLLTYFEREDRVIARDSVRLTRTVDGSMLTGPRVEFLRAVSGVDERTIATGRPHMTLYPGADDPAPPFEVDSDEAVFAGEEEARAVGDVVIVRPDLRAEADSALFRREEGVGVLRGSPRVEAEGIVLRGDTIRFRSEEGELRDVRAVGRGHAVGEALDVEAERIDVRVRAEKVEIVWAHGPGRSVATSGDHRVYGDSLRFALTEGRIDTVVSVGEAAAVRVSGGETARGTPDSTRAPRGGPDETPPDTAAVTPGEARDTLSPADSASVSPGGAAARRPPRLPERRPSLTLDDDASWVTGDTLHAIFEKVARESVGDADPLPPVPEGLELVGPAADSAAARAAPEGAAPPAAPADTAGSPRLERLVVVGNARSFYAAVRDTSRTGRPSRNYMIGREIRVQFEEGEPRRVEGVEAIGLYLEPSEAIQGEGAAARRDSAAVADSMPAVADSLPAARDSVPADSVPDVAPRDMASRDTATAAVARASASPRGAAGGTARAGPAPGRPALRRASGPLRAGRALRGRRGRREGSRR